MPHLPGHPKEEFINFFTDKQAEAYRKWLVSLPLGKIGVSMDTPALQQYFAYKEGFRDEVVDRQKQAVKDYTTRFNDEAKNQFGLTAAPTATPQTLDDRAMANIQAQAGIPTPAPETSADIFERLSAEFSRGIGGPPAAEVFTARQEAYGPNSGAVGPQRDYPDQFSVSRQIGGNVVGAQREGNVFSRAQEAARQKFQTGKLLKNVSLRRRLKEQPPTPTGRGLIK